MMQDRRYVLLSLVFVMGCTPASLVDAIREQEDKGIFGKPQYIVVPMSARSVIGFTPGTALTPDIQNSRLLTAQPARCFFVAPDSAPSLGELRVSYKKNANIKAEVDATAATVGVKASGEDSADLEIKDIKLITGLGVLDLSGPCDIDQSSNINVFTQLVVGGTVSLGFTRKLQIDANVKVPVNTGLSIGAGGGGGSANSTTVIGKDIVLSGALTNVKIDVTKQEQDLGDTPLPNTGYDFPKGFEGSVTIKKFDRSNDPQKPILTINVQTQLNQTIAPPLGFEVCPVNREVELEAGKQCNVWFPAGNALMSVRWLLRPVGGVTHVILLLKGFKTTYTAPTNAAIAASPTPVVAGN